MKKNMSNGVGADSISDTQKGGKTADFLHCKKYLIENIEIKQVRFV